MSGSALVLFSGGQDSTTCLVWAMQKFARVETVGFFYGQRHAIEMECRKRVLQELGPIEDTVLNCESINQISQTALSKAAEFEMAENGFPNTYVAGRNILFLTLASALAYRKKLSTIVGGMCETDYSGYPDCRDDTIKAMQVAVNLGMASRFNFQTPLMWLDKAQTWRLAHKLGGERLIGIIKEYTHTCYRGDRAHRHEWGYGCEECPACLLRKRGYEKYVQG